MKFAEFKTGQVLDAGPYAVSEAEVLNFAQQWDPQWFHTNPDAAARGPFEGLIASGWHTCSIAMRLAADAFLAGSESYASPGLAYIKWPHPVRPNDVLRLRVTVLESRVSQSNSSLGILRWRWQLRNAADTEVLDLEATSLFKLF
jgi:acyl dehydratase